MLFFMSAAANLENIKVLFLDADGVWFSGEETRGELPSGETLILKTRHFHDAQGLSFIRALGIRIVFVSGEGEPLQSIVEKINTLPSVLNGEWKAVEVFTDINKKGGKVEVIEAWLQKNGYVWEECAYIGDDRNDVEPMSRVGLAVCPSDARRTVKPLAHIVLHTAGGKGAVREFAEMLLDARGVDEKTLPPA
jgi:YrbI family 3-deoxy-D-manno-octulosonate 8-phosphate phosphatase